MASQSNPIRIQQKIVFLSLLILKYQSQGTFSQLQLNEHYQQKWLCFKELLFNFDQMTPTVYNLWTSHKKSIHILFQDVSRGGLLVHSWQSPCAISCRFGWFCRHFRGWVAALQDVDQLPLLAHKLLQEHLLLPPQGLDKFYSILLMFRKHNPA